MAVSLVSTGIQFPDSTIQTTAASASSMVKIQTQTFSGASSVTFSSGITSTYKSYLLIFTNIYSTTASNASLSFDISADGGSTWLTNWASGWASLNTTNAPNFYNSWSASRNSAWMADQWSNSSSSTLSGQLLIANPTGTGSYKQVSGYFVMNSGSGEPSPSFATANNKNAVSSVINAFRVYGSGTITGTLSLYGIT